jgi:hypothetical protein
MPSNANGLVARPQTVETRPRWKRPAIPAAGALHVASVCFPGGYNKAFKAASGTPKKKLFGIGAAPEGKMIEFGFFLAREPMHVLEHTLSSFGLPIVHMSMPNGDSVSAVARMREIKEKDRATLRELRIPVAAIPEVSPGGKLDNVSATSDAAPSPPDCCWRTRVRASWLCLPLAIGDSTRGLRVVESAEICSRRTSAEDAAPMPIGGPSPAAVCSEPHTTQTARGRAESPESMAGGLAKRIVEPPKLGA